jgi:hypothetical protein
VADVSAEMHYFRHARHPQDRDPVADHRQQSEQDDGGVEQVPRLATAASFSRSMS